MKEFRGTICLATCDLEIDSRGFRDNPLSVSRNQGIDVENFCNKIQSVSSDLANDVKEFQPNVSSPFTRDCIATEKFYAFLTLHHRCIKCLQNFYVRISQYRSASTKLRRKGSISLS